MPSLRQFSTFRDILNAQLLARKQKNPAYSLRAFAKNIGMSPSRLSEVLNAGKTMSQKSAATIGARLFEKESDLQYFKDLVTIEALRDESERELVAARINAYRNC
jgi:hypothetical protein